MEENYMVQVGVQEEISGFRIRGCKVQGSPSSKGFLTKARG